MKNKFLPALGMALALAFAANPAFADKPEWAGGNKHEKKWDKDDRRGDDDRRGHGGRRGHDDDRHGHRSGHRYFNDHHRHAVNEYYGQHYGGGKKCPPGLAKKNNGCLPPGQARKWQVGHPLPRDVVYYSVPNTLVIQLGAPPRGHKYVRVGADILMIAVGTGLVVDAINDLGRM